MKSRIKIKSKIKNRKRGSLCYFQMPLITKIIEQKRRPNRRNIYLDGSFAFGCNVNVVARFRLRVGLQLTDEQLNEIQRGEVRQECFDAAMKFLQQRLHSRAV